MAGEAGALLAGAHVGLAMFDKDLRLLACNERYRVLRCHTPEEVAAGTSLTELLRRVLERLDLPPAEAEERIATVVAELVPGSNDGFRYVGSNAQLLELHRRCLPSGTIVETVRELEASHEVTDLNVQFAKMAANARQRMMHALDVMAEGFALFDGDGHLTVFNKKYVETRNLIAELITVGASYEALLREEIRRGALDLTGSTAEQLVERRLNWHRNPVESIEVHMADGRWLRISETRTSDGGCVQTRADITQMKEREADLLRLTRDLHSRNAMFDILLDNMSQGLCLFDADQRVVFANHRYADIYGLKSEYIQPGTSLKEILEARLAMGVYGITDGQKYVSDGQASFRQKVSQVLTLADGRSIAVVRLPMPDGSLVSTHEDITERETLNARLAVQHMHFDAALGNMLQGLAMYDAEPAPDHLQPPLPRDVPHVGGHREAGHSARRCHAAQCRDRQFLRGRSQAHFGRTLRSDEAQGPPDVQAAAAGWSRHRSRQRADAGRRDDRDLHGRDRERENRTADA